MSVTVDRVRALIVPLLDDLGVELYDLDHVGGSLRITVDRPGGIELESITAATRAISVALDEADLVPGAYTLEVSSPGIERALRTEDHFRGAIGDEVKIKTRPGVDGDRRAEGRLTSLEGTTITVTAEDGTTRSLALADIDRAHTVYDWAPTPKPGKQPATKKSGKQPAGKKSAGKKPAGQKSAKKSPKPSSSTTTTPKQPTQQKSAGEGAGSNTNSEATP